MKTSVPLALCLLATGALVSCSNKTAPASETAPAAFNVLFDTTKGPFSVAVTRADAPLGADRFYNLVKTGFYDGARFFRVVPGFIVQFGEAGDPKLNRQWNVPIHDDPVVGSNVRGTLTFAAAGPDTRTTQLFVNLGNNPRLNGDPSHFAVIGKVTSGMENVDRIYSGYGEKPQQDQIEASGNAYLERDFPSLDYIRTARIVH